ncbi:MAG: hypothetical protein LAO30_17385 [Acidobacteriia bacterium]|nr:hypothetical protein [Terriglobia bacterium]
MPSFETKIADVVLRRIRSRAPALSSGGSAESAIVGGGRVLIRQAEFTDFEAVCALNHRLGQGPDSMENWHRLWRDNPAVAQGAPARIGWVLECAGKVVGFLGSIPLLSEYDGRLLFTAATCRFAIEPAHRPSGHLLVTSFLRQKDVDLFLNTTATVSAGKIMMALKAAPVPQSDYGKVLFWVLKPRAFADAVLTKMGVRSSLRPIGGFLAAGALAAETAFRRRTPRENPSRYRVVVSSVDRLGETFDRFCLEQTRTAKRLIGVRTSDIMHWHFVPPQSRRATEALSCYSAGALVGYAIMRHEVETGSTLRRSLIADLLVQNDDPLAVEQLLVAAYRSAKQSGSHVLEVIGFPKQVRRVLLQHKPYSRDYPASPYFYKARDRQLHDELSNENAWYACPFDGDATLWP